MPAPVDSRNRFMRTPPNVQKAREQAAHDAHMAELSRPTGRDRPAWMSNKDLLPKSPPTRTGRP